MYMCGFDFEQSAIRRMQNSCCISALNLLLLFASQTLCTKQKCVTPPRICQQLPVLSICRLPSQVTKWHVLALFDWLTCVVLHDHFSNTQAVCEMYRPLSWLSIMETGRRPWGATSNVQKSEWSIWMEGMAATGLKTWLGGIVPSQLSGIMHRIWQIHEVE